MVALLDEHRLHRQRSPVTIDRQLLDVETEFVDAPHPLLDPPSVVEIELLDSGQFTPQLLVARTE